MKFNALLLLCAACFSAVAQVKTVAPASKQLLRIDSILNQVLKDQRIAGFAVAVIKGDEVIYSKGFGYRDLVNKKPVTPNTLFAIGSSTKAFTASLIGLLEKEGKLNFDGKAIDYLPQLRFYSTEMNNQITVRDLMSHRTGLSRYDESWVLFNTANRDSIIGRVKYMEPTAPVRQQWLYNNFMFLAQGMIVEKMTKKTWEQNISEKFFVPLQMTRSTTDLKAFQNDGDASLPYQTTDQGEIKKIDYYNINGMGPAGSINSSVNDMSNWLKVWISGGYFNKKEILPSSYIASAASSQMVIAPALPNQQNDIYLSNYGLGWMLSSYRGHYMVEHGGNINGFSASVAFFPTDQLGIVVLTNQNQSPVPDLVRNSVADQLLNLTTVDWNGKAKAQTKAAMAMVKQQQALNKVKQVLNTSPSHPLKDYVGRFENPAYGILDVKLINNVLYATVGENKLMLKHWHYDVFEPKLVGKNNEVDTSSIALLFNFASDQAGKINSLSLPFNSEGKPVVFQLKKEEIKLTPKELERYTGEYLLGMGTVSVYVKEGKLYVFVPGQPEYETRAAAPDVFELTALKGYSLKFETFVQDKAAVLSFIQPNGIFKAQRKK
jgi:CubicO group peptidase (beta-lactamase class C family)